MLFHRPRGATGRMRAVRDPGPRYAWPIRGLTPARLAGARLLLTAAPRSPRFYSCRF